jgi:hypothetical protein
MSKLERARFSREVARNSRRFAYLQQMARGVGMEVPDCVLRRSLIHLPYRLASLRIAPELHPLPDDSGLATLRDILRAMLVPQGLRVQSRLALLAWSVAVLTAPRGLAERLVLWRFAQPSRPALLQSILQSLRIAA